MRKFLLMAMVFITINTLAQDYQLTVSGYIGSGPSGCGGNNNGLKWIKAIFDDGSEDFLFSQSGQFRNNNYTTSKNYNTAKRLVGVKFRSISRRNGSLGCKAPRISDKMVSVSSPSFNKRFEKNEIYESAINEGYAVISVEQTYKLTVSGYIGSGPSSCGPNNNGLKWIKAIFDDGSEAFLFNQTVGQFRNRSYSFSKIYSNNKRLTGVKFRSVSRRNSWRGCRSPRISEKEVSVSFSSFNRRFEKNEIYESSINSGYAIISVVQTSTTNTSSKHFEREDKQELLSNSMKEESKLFEISMYPNPSPDGRFKVATSSAKSLPVTVEIFNLVDKRKVLEDVKTGNENYFFEFNSSNLKPGIYIIQVTSGGRKQLKKLIVE
ncbi:T9SS type A sorting domain-containing protein [Aquimarina sp. 2201CG1-2-11]|uniref:T9SS type A sorting domain-containing protein n=1 Tax=Aquimarina discodermiae TaxID=3231043 RepID=UPI003461D18D